VVIGGLIFGLMLVVASWLFCRRGRVLIDARNGISRSQVQLAIWTVVLLD
jgi:hypothetical protein